MNSDKGKVSRSGSGFSAKEPPKKRPNTEQRTSTSSNSAYKTRCSDGSGFKKSRRYSPGLPTRRKRRDGGNASLNSSDATDSTIPKSNGLPRKEVTSANFLNVKQRRSARITAALVKAPAAIGAGARAFKCPQSQAQTQLRNRDMPKRCTPNNKFTFILYRSEALAVRRVTKDLSIFFTQADREKRAPKGNNAAYFGFRSRHPIVNSSQQQTNNQEQEWKRQMVVRRIEDFVDLSRPEKEFMKMWNLYMLKPNTKALDRCHVYHTYRVFVETHRNELLEKDLKRAWVYHLVAQSGNGALDSDEFHDLIMRLKPDYDPAQDVIHPVYRMKNADVDDQPSTSKRKVPRAWQRAQIHGPKTSILRSASYTGAAGPSSDTDEISKRLATSLIRDEGRCSSCSTDEATRQLHTMKRHRECNLNKYLQPIGQSSTENWLKIDEDADDNVHDNPLLLPKTEG